MINCIKIDVLKNNRVLLFKVGNVSFPFKFCLKQFFNTVMLKVKIMMKYLLNKLYKKITKKVSIMVSIFFALSKLLKKKLKN